MTKYIELCEEFLQALETEELVLYSGGYRIGGRFGVEIKTCPFCGKRLDGYGVREASYPAKED